MNSNIHSSFEDDIFTNDVNDTTKGSQNNITKREREDLENLDENLEKQKMEIVLTDIICDGNALQNLIESEDISEAPSDFSKYKFNNFIVSDNEYLIKLQKADGALIMFDDGELMLRSSSDADFKKVTEERASRVISKLIGEFVIVGKGSKDRPPNIKYDDLLLP
jgi:hypothetical protein